MKVINAKLLFLNHRFGIDLLDYVKDKTMADTEIFVLDNGPLIVKGEFSVTDGDKQPYPKQEQVALCRCGASSNKPFCDGAHAKAGFEATERAPGD
ncbi:CDGSH iron-sulfur domain-containing protein [Adonisia turfae]|nr:CDGSH iron-sulfur domain-containing protein [Adonisia turfae]